MGKRCHEQAALLDCTGLLSWPGRSTQVFCCIMPNDQFVIPLQAWAPQPQRLAPRLRVFVYDLPFTLVQMHVRFFATAVFMAVHLSLTWRRDS